MTTYDQALSEPFPVEDATAEFDEGDDLLPYRVHGRNRPGEERSRRRQRPVFRDVAEAGQGPIASEFAESSEEGGLPMSYRPARFEEVWLRSSLRSFYDQALIQDVLAQVKGGKEANVYRCQAHPRTELDLIAAKVYRPRKFRNLSNDRMYREGRPILTGEGTPVRPSDHRIIRAVGKKTDFGVQVQHTSWLMYEYTTLETLHRAGAAVPKPIGANENAILMSYHGDEFQAAPALQQIRLTQRDAHRLFDEVLRNIELLLQHGLIHGDLSAYNILYWEDEITLIDFPQVTSVEANRNAEPILQRDVRRVCEYFARQGVRSDPTALARGMWERYGVVDAVALEFLEDADG
ncbi:MAG TPA: RIO1 family regulatory kinase/ATPase [Chloroflexota bacterium]|nr:RIO1 family regulatory kinase/ATPase [Chloroflexota bacterium]